MVPYTFSVVLPDAKACLKTCSTSIGRPLVRPTVGKSRMDCISMLCLNSKPTIAWTRPGRMIVSTSPPQIWSARDSERPASARPAMTARLVGG